MMHFLSLLMPHHFYYDVPPCPKCGSVKTGRYIKRPRRTESCEYTYEQSLRHGELIRFMDREPVRNAFCAECGYRWGWHVSAKRVSSSYIDRQIEARGLRESIDALEDEQRKKPKPGFLKRNFLW